MPPVYTPLRERELAEVTKGRRRAERAETMSRSHRWLATIVTASVLLASSAAATAAPRPWAAFNPCPKTFTISMFFNGALKAYRGERIPTEFDRSQLRKFMRCARHTSDKPVDVKIWHRAMSDNWKRRHPPVVQPESSLVVCIMWRESTDNPEAVNGSHEGLGQWDENAWYAGDGERFAATPLGASYSEQVQVLNDMLPQQLFRWQPWDHC